MTTRRGFVGWAAAGVAVAALGGVSAARPAEAGTVTSWDFPENDGLTDEEIAARFDLIDATYGDGEVFADADVDFVLRYGTPAPTGNLGHTQMATALAPNDELADPDAASAPVEGAALHTVALMCRTEASYEGDFTYRFTESACLQAGFPDGVRMEAEASLTVYGWRSPFQGPDGMCGFGIVWRAEHRHEKGEGWELLANWGDEFVGIAAVYRAVYRGALSSLADGSGPDGPIALGPLDSTLAPDALVRRYRANDDLTDDEQFERFQEMGERYDVGDSLSEVDADFVDRYTHSVWDGSLSAE